jgi:CcmD family protein
MGAWGYVFLAYGIVWGAIVAYLISLKHRLRKAELELAHLRATKDLRDHAQK